MEPERPKDAPGAPAPAADAMEEALEPAPDASAPAPDKASAVEPRTGRLPAPAEDIHTRMLDKMSHEERKYLLTVTGFGDFLKSTNRLFWTNFLMGLARGVGFVIGMSIIGAIFVSVWYEFLSVSGLGRFISRIISEINKNAPK